MQQLDFLSAFDATPAYMLARSTNPSTSHAAAATVKEFAAGHHDLILATLRERGDLTVHEIAAYCRLTSYEVGKRMHELEKAGKARVARTRDAHSEREITRPSPSGRQARVWEVV